VTACILTLGMHEVGRDDVEVYDGSWCEWGSREDVPVKTAS
jgi:thiosulfate/3-mercaptopyruvate sulfurtransferase